MSQQLVKKGADGRMVNVNPRSWIEAIKDKNTGQTLVEILQGFNMYFLSYNGNSAATRKMIPNNLRRKGLWLSYVKYDGNVHTEWYAADEIDDESWGDSSNWRSGNNTLVGDITISANGNWVINGTETEFKAVGEKGNTPLIRVANNRLQVSYDLGYTYKDVTNNPVYTKFRWLATTGDTKANNVGRIQASTDEGKTWTNMSNDFTNNLHISRYIGVNESLPTSGIAEGTIYAKGPYYAEDDNLNDNPIYRLWVYAWKGNILTWQDNGEFQSIAAGVVQETGNSETEVMSQKAVTDKLSELGSKMKLANFVNGIFTKVSEKNNYENSYDGDYVDVKLTRNEDVFNGGNIVLCRDFYNRSKRLFFNHYDGSRSQGTITFDSNGIAQINIDESVDNAVIADFNAELKTTVYVYSNPQQYFNEKNYKYLDTLREELNSKLDKEIVKREIIYEYLMDNLSNAAWTTPLPSDCILIESVKNDTISEGAYFNIPLNPYYSVFDLTVEFDIVFDSSSIQYEGHPNFFWWTLNGMKLKGEGWTGSTVLQTGKKYNLRFEYKRKSDQIKVYVDGVLEADVTKSASINTNINMQMFGLEKGKNTTYANVVGRRRRIKMYVDDVLRYNFYAVECNGRYGYYESIEEKLYFSESAVEFKK